MPRTEVTPFPWENEVSVQANAGKAGVMLELKGAGGIGYFEA